MLGKVTMWIGQAFGYDGLFVVDGALVNGASGTVNPALTVAGLADKIIIPFYIETENRTNLGRKSVTFPLNAHEILFCRVGSLNCSTNQTQLIN